MVQSKILEFYMYVQSIAKLAFDFRKRIMRFFADNSDLKDHKRIISGNWFESGKGSDVG